VESDERPAPPPHRDLYGDGDKKKDPQSAAGVLSGAKRIAAGVKVLLEWLGSGAKPVDHALATARAAVCAECPRNEGGDWRAMFTQPVANRIRQQLEIKNDMKLVTVHDAKLSVCSACLCPLILKPWTPLQHVLDNTSDEVRKALAPQCWVLNEKL